MWRITIRRIDHSNQERTDLVEMIDNLLDDIACGDKYMKFYKQMKMYNDPSLNPVLYGGKTE